MEYLFIILFVYASYLSIEKYVHTGGILTWRGGKDKKERPAAPAAIHPEIPESGVGIIGKSRYQMRQSLTMDDNNRQPESGIEKSDTFTPEKECESPGSSGSFSKIELSGDWLYAGTLPFFR